MMKNLRRVLVAIVAMVAVSTTASAQFSFGPRVGVAVNSLKFNTDVFDSSNRAGFTGGVQLEFMIPAINLGFDVSLMYVRRSSDVEVDTKDADLSSKVSKDYFEIPVNLKYKIGLPVVGSVISPYVFTGPGFAFLTSGTAIKEVYEAKKFDVSWNFGFGLQLFRKVQIAASYGLGLSKSIVNKAIGDYEGGNIVNGKNRFWTITAAYLF